ncbi:hypothetical protein KJ636_04090 [Patescibacteria group bacterium]|nr:hypothetical protein [Patescibacteria group bacterium]
MGIKTLPQIKPIYPFLKQKEWILIWRKVKGIWKNRRPDPLKKLKEMRKEWERVY